MRAFESTQSSNCGVFFPYFLVKMINVHPEHGYEESKGIFTATLFKFRDLVIRLKTCA